MALVRTAPSWRTLLCRSSKDTFSLVLGGQSSQRRAENRGERSFAAGKLKLVAPAAVVRKPIIIVNAILRDCTSWQAA
jgi:hypothetical protein